jgi:hypothetical protein
MSEPFIHDPVLGDLGWHDRWRNMLAGTFALTPKHVVPLFIRTEAGGDQAALARRLARAARLVALIRQNEWDYRCWLADDWIELAELDDDEPPQGGNRDAVARLFILREVLIRDADDGANLEYSAQFGDKSARCDACVWLDEEGDIENVDMDVTS